MGITVYLLICLLIAVGSAASFPLQLCFWRRTAGRQTLDVQLRRLSGMIIFIPGYGLLVLVGSFMFGMPEVVGVVVCMITGAIAAAIHHYLQVLAFVMSMADGIAANVATLSAMKTDDKAQLLWYLRYFGWALEPVLKKRMVEIRAIDAALSESLSRPRPLHLPPPIDGKHVR